MRREKTFMDPAVNRGLKCGVDVCFERVRRSGFRFLVGILLLMAFTDCSLI